jgi:cobyrinic acid a,c-diamide synthase
MDHVSTARVVIAGTSSGAGKTTVAAGLIGALRRRGLIVQPFKCGPDYIDPTYHTLAAGRPCRNLDAWMLQETELRETFDRACAGADIAVIEGVMGLFDGANWDDAQASTAHLAKLFQAPVILVLDIAGAARSAAIGVAGCQRLDPDLDLRGVILNFAGSERHAQGCATAILSQTQVPTVGWLPRQADLGVPERHLGLVPGGEQPQAQSLLERLAATAERQFDLPAIIALGSRTAAPVSPGRVAPMPAVHVAPAAPVLAVARDEAFSFYYPENLELLEEAGIRIEFFSPVAGEAPTQDVAGVYFGGGYPELHAQNLSQNRELWSGLRKLREREAPIYGECGGFMVLTEGLTDLSGAFWPMAALIPGKTRMSERLVGLGYRYATALQSNLLAAEGETLRGHEFHYSAWIDAPSTQQAWLTRSVQPGAAVVPQGYVQGNLLASYLHVHFGQDPRIAQRFAALLRTSGFHRSELI